jgi:hypothetical protein
MDLQQAGGLTARKMESNEAAVALTRAANTSPAKILTKANTITLDTPAPASWFGHVMTKDLIPAGTPRSGRVFGQYRAAIGGCYNATDRGTQTELMPSSTRSLIHSAPSRASVTSRECQADCKPA